MVMVWELLVPGLDTTVPGVGAGLVVVVVTPLMVVVVVIWPLAIFTVRLVVPLSPAEMVE
jgi:hypothetical protein